MLEQEERPIVDALGSEHVPRDVERQGGKASRLLHQSPARVGPERLPRRGARRRHPCRLCPPSPPFPGRRPSLDPFLAAASAARSPASRSPASSLASPRTAPGSTATSGC